ncbi:hypothetical protein DUNSADRAFT_8968 [Dunaliella salina]|uniref:Uncharacterized protein n=1 Tax=Dunaliella salina TaxID=3046 RepID=A0ABQ7GIE2_DUNSA|nr:hypothetical protein DUNSADRAFT_8968 [Dunaliella salina]|eukprot:KAF5834382.1 hypothetical protein DUNSADRAFT_8968 [Dunaliella salina]
MVNNKANKNARVREQRQVTQIRAKELLDLWRVLTELDVQNFTVESALLNSPDFNYYEKLMLYLIHKHAVQAEKAPNIGDKHERENDMVILERHTAWLINNSEQIREQETAWSDVVSFVLQRLHMCASVADNGGPCWLTYDAEALDSSLLEAVRHLEKDGLIFRKHSKEDTCIQRSHFQEARKKDTPAVRCLGRDGFIFRKHSKKDTHAVAPSPGSM